MQGQPVVGFGQPLQQRYGGVVQGSQNIGIARGQGQPLQGTGQYNQLLPSDIDQVDLNPMISSEEQKMNKDVLEEYRLKEIISNLPNEYTFPDQDLQKKAQNEYLQR